MSDKIKILKEEKYRSRPLVNMTEDMVRITMTIPIHKLRRLKELIKEDT